MINDGRESGWLKLPVQSALQAWAKFHGAQFNGIRFASIPGKEERGMAIIADKDFAATDNDDDDDDGENHNTVMVISQDLILSRRTVEEISKSNHQLREILEAAGSFAKTSRGAVMIFLLLQATATSPKLREEKVGLHHPLNEYIKFLPSELLPTFWTEDERALLLKGTTLGTAIEAKIRSLYREFSDFRTATEKLTWCERWWWDEVENLESLTFDDWKEIDASYRSRVLDFPGHADEAMVPCIDMANHSAGRSATAYYDFDSDENAILKVHKGKVVNADDEITITYGDDKSACEMLFSYGFIDEDASSAKALYLDLEIPEDDPLKRPKRTVSESAPGFHIRQNNGHISWDSDFIWIICVNEEDGLSFKVQQTVSGDTDLVAFWKGDELTDTSKLGTILQQDPHWDLYRLRAVCIMQARVRGQLSLLVDSEVLIQRCLTDPYHTLTYRNQILMGSKRLRTLEGELLNNADSFFESEKARLLESDIVQTYFRSAQ